MPPNPTQLLGAVLVVAVGLAATSGVASAPATGSRLPADAAQGKSKIAFVSRGPQQAHGLYVVSADGSGQRRLTGSVLVRTPEWSPDGRRIAFEGGDGTNGIYVVSADGSFRVRLARHGRTPAWSPDGRKLAFFSGSRIYLMNADGSGQRNLTRSPANEGRFAWAPGRSKQGAS